MSALSGGGSTPQPSGPPHALAWAPLAGALSALYGLPSWSFREFAFWEVPGAPTIYMAMAGADHPATLAELLNTGWPILTGPLPAGRPVLALFRIVGMDATRNVVALDAAGEADYARTGHVAVPAEAEAAVLIVRRGKRVLGAVCRATGRADAAGLSDPC